MSRDWSFKLYHQDLKNQSNVAITELKADIEHLQEARQRLRNYINDTELVSQGFTAIRLKAMDTIKVIEGLILAAELDIRDHRTLIEAVGNEDLLGFDIQGEYEAAKAQAEYYAERAQYFQGDRFIVSYVTIYTQVPHLRGTLIPSQTRQTRLDMARRNAYNDAVYLRDAYSRLMKEWLEKAASYDRIEEATKGLFQPGRELRDKSNAGLRLIGEASRGLPSRFTHPGLEGWRNTLSKKKEQAENQLRDTLSDKEALERELRDLEELLRSLREHPDFEQLSDEDFEKRVTWELELFRLAREFEPIMRDYVIAAEEARESSVTLGGRTPWADLIFLADYALFLGVPLDTRREILSFLRGEHEDAEGMEALSDRARMVKLEDFLDTRFANQLPANVSGVSIHMGYSASYGHMNYGQVMYESMRRDAMQIQRSFGALAMIYLMGVNSPFKNAMLKRPKRTGEKLPPPSPRGTGGNNVNKLPSQSVRNINDSPTFKPSQHIPRNANGHTQSNARLGREVHQEFRKIHENGKTIEGEFRLPSGRRVDLIDFNTKTIYELKPHNPGGIRAGLRQLEIYRIEIEKIFGPGWSTVLVTY